MDTSLFGVNLVVYSNSGFSNYGVAGDGQHPIILKYSISAPVVLTYTDSVTWNAGEFDICDTTTIAGDYLYISCGFMDYATDLNVLPYVAQIELNTFNYVKTFNMGFYVIQSLPVPDYADR